VWPRLASAAATRGVVIGLVSATLAAGSSRRGAMAARLLRGAYARLDTVGAIDEADAERLAELGVARDRISVTGDTRYDQVWARVQSVDRTSGLVAALASDRPTLVAGSTWPADEERLLPAWLAVRHAVPGARLVIAPHEPTAAHLSAIERWAGEHGIRTARLTSAEASGADLVVVDRVGVLGDLYALAGAAYVGGGFHAAGLHSVLEPAAFGAPVAFGPRFANSRDAGLLIAAGGGVSVDGAAALGGTLGTWLSDTGARTEAGAAARRLVERGLGAAERSWRLVAALLDGGGRQRPG
jgi:3-deoxy-D-manno-octulosonic-acid transferase